MGCEHLKINLKLFDYTLYVSEITMSTTSLAVNRRSYHYQRNDNQRHYEELLSSSYPYLDRYGRTPQKFLCRNCIIYMDNPVVAEKHYEVTRHEVDELF